VEELDVWELLKSHVADLQRQGFEVQLSGDGPTLYLGNLLALDRILANLLNNAAHYGGGMVAKLDLPTTTRT